MLALLLFALAATGETKEKPFVEPGTEPVDDRPIGPRDQWARMRISIDKQGYPIRCQVFESNIRSRERRFWFCHAMTHGWHAAPVLENGVPIETTVIRRLVLRGRD